MTRCRSCVVEPGKKTTFTAPADILLTNATFDPTISDESSRTTLKLIYETPQRLNYESDEEEEEKEDQPEQTTTILCSLTPGKVYRKHLIFGAQFSDVDLLRLNKLR